MALAHSYADVSQLLGDRIDQLAPACLPAARISGCGKYWEVGSLDGRPGGKSWQLKINRKRIGPHDPGAWHDFASHEHGDALDLVAASMFGGNGPRADTWALGWLGLDAAAPLTLAEHKRLQRERRAAAKARAEQAEAELMKTRRVAKAMWLAGAPIDRYSPVVSYLDQRGIDLNRLPLQVNALRFSWDVWNSERGERLPAMLAAVSRPAAGFVACHRTWLERGGTSWRKADLAEAKKSYGSVAGGLIPLARGATGRGWSEMREPEPVAIGEGIEDSLSAAIAVPELRVACAVSLPNLQSLAPEWSFSEVIVLGQNDPAGSDAAKLQARVIASLAESGRRVRLAAPPEGVKDWNDWIRQRAEVAA